MIRRLQERARTLAGPAATRIEVLIRYYSVALINTAFGYGLYAGLIFVGLNLYLAQLIAHITGTTFNYFMYSRHVFLNADRKPLAYIATYALSYLIGLGLLFIARHIVSSPYLAGLLALIVGSGINFLILKRFAFPSRRQKVASGP